MAQEVALTIKHHPQSRKLTDMPKDSMVFFLNYHPGNTRFCRVMYGELVGWVFIHSAYSKSTNFFHKVRR